MSKNSIIWFSSACSHRDDVERTSPFSFGGVSQIWTVSFDSVWIFHIIWTAQQLLRKEIQLNFFVNEFYDISLYVIFTLYSYSKKNNSFSQRWLLHWIVYIVDCTHNICCISNVNFTSLHRTHSLSLSSPHSFRHLLSNHDIFWQAACTTVLLKRMLSVSDTHNICVIAHVSYILLCMCADLSTAACLSTTLREYTNVVRMANLPRKIVKFSRLNSQK